MLEIAQALYNPIAYQSQIEQLERRTRQLSVFDDDVDQQQLVLLTFVNIVILVDCFSRDGLLKVVLLLYLHRVS